MMSTSNPESSDQTSKLSNVATFNDENSSSNEKIAEGYLDREKLLKNLSNFGRTALGNSFAYLELSLQGSGLVDISLIGNYKELQNVDLSYNNIKDLSVLSELKYLVSLNVSNNQVDKPFDFLTPYNLKEAWFSFNNIREIGNLSNYHYLQTLDLSHNKIEKIEGLEYCQRLRYLNLSNNAIVKIEGLTNLPIINLLLSGNRIKKIEGINSLKYLQILDLSSNNIRSMNGIPERAEFLEKIFLQDNKIQNITDLDYLVNLKMLRNLNLKSNPIREVENSRLIILFKIPHLEVLDGRKVDCHEKVNADDMFFPNVEYIAARDHMTNLVFNSIQDHKVKESTLPDVNSPYPILILCGAQGSGSQEMAIRLVKEFPEYFDFVPLHCTKKPLPSDKDKHFYKHLNTNEFDDDVLHGKFVCCNEYFGDWYGIKWDSIEAVAAQGLACVIHMELDALISFKKTYFEPRCVLVTTLDRNIQFERLKANDFTEFECEVARTRADLYEEHNKEHPGFFDSVIITDNLNQGFTTLKNLVLNYLGLSSIDQIYNSIIQNGAESDSKNSSMHTNYTKSIDKKNQPSDLHRTDSFLPSNTATGNRSQMSHMSIESLSQMYSQSLRLKFGSAPAELFGKGEHAEKSIVRRIQEIKKQFESNNLVNSKSQIEKSLRMHGREDSMSMSSIGGGGRTSADARNNNNNNKKNSAKPHTTKIVDTDSSYNRKKTTVVVDSESSNDDDFID